MRVFTVTAAELVTEGETSNEEQRIDAGQSLADGRRLRSTRSLPDFVEFHQTKNDVQSLKCNPFFYPLTVLQTGGPVSESSSCKQRFLGIF